MYNYKMGYVIPMKIKANGGTSIEGNDGLRELAHEIKSEVNIENSIKINDELFINASHELKTPLNIIYSSAQLIELYLKTDEENQTVDKIAAGINSIKQNTFRLMKVLNNILDLHKIEAGLLKLNYSYVNIVEVVEGVFQRVSELMKDKQLGFIFDTDTEEKYMMADTEKIERVILNILSNAVKFSNPGGIIYANVAVKKSTVEISIRDTGIGINKKNMDNIFNRFGQVDMSFSRQAEGNGIGLSLTKAFVEAHGGSIHVSSKPNKGSTFVVKLPCSKKESVYTLYTSRVINFDSLNEMIKIEFSDIENMGA